MTPVAPRIVKSFICDEDEAGESFCVAGAALGEVQVSLSWQVQHLLTFKCHLSWQVQQLVRFKCHFLWQVQHLVKFHGSSVTFHGRGNIL